MSEELYNSNDYCSLAEQYEELKKENAELTADKAHLMNLFMESSEYIFDVVSNMKINDLERKCKVLEADYVISNRELLILQSRIAELEEKQRWIPVSERPKECEMRVFKDGNAWCFVLPDFQDLQVSPSVWMKKGVLDKIYKELRSVRNE